MGLSRCWAGLVVLTAPAGLFADVVLPTGGVRGLAVYDGVFYVGHYQQATVAAYDAGGRRLCVYRLERRRPFLGHGVATDGKSLWTTDYSGKTIFEFDRETGRLRRQFAWAGPGNPTRMECDGRDLYVTAYRDPTVYRIGRDGRLLAKFKTDSTDENLQIALTDADTLLISDRPAGRLLIYDKQGKRLGEVPGDGGRWVLATDARTRTGPLYGDTENGRSAIMALAKTPIPEYVTESNRKQDWMIWGGTDGPRPTYQPTGDGVRIVDGPRTFNRPLYGDHIDSLVLGGDRAQVMLARAPGLCLGVLSVAAVGDPPRFLHDLPGVEMTYDGATVWHRLRHDALGGATVTLRTVAFRDGVGFVARLSADRPVELIWTYGGVGKASRLDGQGGHPGGIDVKRHQGNEIAVTGPVARITAPKATQDAVWVQGDPGGKLMVAAAADPFAEGPFREAPLLHQRITIGPDAPQFVRVGVSTVPVRPIATADLSAEFEANCKHFLAVRNRLRVETPDAALNSAVRLNNMTQDALWYPDSFLHGALRWGVHCNCWFLGWRGWYGASVMGWHDRVERAVRLHARHQIRSDDWLNGYVISVLPFDGKHDGRFHYNMQEVYLDHLYYDYHYTGDKALARDLLKTVKAALGFQKHALDADGNHLYLNRLNTWISDGHVYNGDCTQASAYTYRANLMAAEFARVAGEDPRPFEAEAAAIKQAMLEKLWIGDRGYFCEYVDADGVRHDAAEAPSQYHPIDFYVTDPFQTYQAMRYIEERLWRLGDQILVNDWYPVIVTNGTLANAELLNTALCYYRIGERDKPYRLLRSAMRSFYAAAVPGSISCYTRTDAAQGTYVDFADAVSMFARTVAEGTFGLVPRMQDGAVTVRPAFPEDWDTATYDAPDFGYTFRRQGDTEQWALRAARPAKWIVQLGYKRRHVVSATTGGQPIEIARRPGIGHEWAELSLPAAKTVALSLTTKPLSIALRTPSRIARGDTLQATGATVVKVHDPQAVLSDVKLQAAGGLTGKVVAQPGPHTLFALVDVDGRRQWQPIDLDVRSPLEIRDARLGVARRKDRPVELLAVLVNHTDRPLGGPIRIKFPGLRRQPDAAKGLPPGGTLDVKLPIDDPTALSPGRLALKVTAGGETAAATTIFWRLLAARDEVRTAVASRLEPVPVPANRAFESIFKGQPHLTDDEEHEPRLHYWTWYKSDYVNLDRLRKKLDERSVYTTAIHVPFRIARSGKNGLFLSRWKGWPSTATMPVNVRAEKLYLLMANVTTNNNTYLTNATITVRYDDGTTTEAALRNPDNFDHTCQHFSDNFPVTLGGREGRYFGHGRAGASHADVFDVATDPTRTIRSLELRVMTRRTMVGLLAVTALKPR